ncbi:DUF551 domain-containing protein [Escherichia coli]|uniref:DUF551 domain-containing protein n=1 Tax=Escherichia coli TaxID=562 RepID=UPI003ED79915
MPLYAAPPAPVVPDKLPREHMGRQPCHQITASMAKSIALKLGAELNNEEAEIFADGYNAAVLHGAKPVSQTYKLNKLSGNSPVTPDGWISCSERMPVIGELNWRTSFPLLVTCEIGVIPAYYGFVSVNGDRHYGFMESLKYGDDSGGHHQTNEYGLISNVTHWMPLPEPPSRMVNNAAS